MSSGTTVRTVTNSTSRLPVSFLAGEGKAFSELCILPAQSHITKDNSSLQDNGFFLNFSVVIVYYVVMKYDGDVFTYLQISVPFTCTFVTPDAISNIMAHWVWI